MLNPGKSSGSGSGLLLNSSSLQPQTVFRQTKASFSVRRPSMTVMRNAAVSSFSKKAESKYSDGMKLLHLKPSTSSTASTVQRSPASMPLPTAGGAAPVAQNTGASPVSMPSSSPVSSSSYPAKSERRPVVFDRSDGPSDFEKRLMAAKKQKQEQEAKQRGPDRRRVRTERVEISSSNSKDEVNRDFAPFDVPEPPVPAAPKGERSVPETKRTEPSVVERQADTGTPHKVQSQPTTSTIETRVARRPVNPGNVVAREFDPTVKNDSQPQTSVVQSSASVPSETVQHEPGKKIEDSGARDQVSVSVSESQSAVQRETVRSNQDSGVRDQVSLPVSEPQHTVQRETVRSNQDSGVRDQVSLPVSESKSTVQRETVKTAAPINKSEIRNQKSEISADGSETVQRETAATNQLPSTMSATVNREPATVIQRETVKSAATVESHVERNNTPLAEPVSESQSTVQRETVKSAEPLRSESEPMDLPVVQRQMSAEVNRRETLKSAVPMVPSDRNDSNSGNVIQRERSQKGADFNTQQSPIQNTGSSVNSHVSSAVPVVQREPDDDLSSLLRSLPMHYEMPKEQIESIRRGEPQKAQNNAVQREYVRPGSSSKPDINDSQRLSPAASVQSSVQRELDLVLPKHKTGDSGSNSENAAFVQRELISKLPDTGVNPSNSTVMRSFGNLPGANNRPQGDRSTQSPFPGTDNSFNNRPDSSTVQREMTEKPKTDISDIGSDAEEAAAPDKDLLPEVTPRDLEKLADKLVPRIKRIMRSEMERSIFR